MKATLVITTAGSKEEARNLAESLVHEKLAACVNVIPGATSFYTWEGKAQSSEEYLLFIKTGEHLYSAVEAYLKTHHSYDVPECVAIAAQNVDPDYLRWMTESVRETR